MPVQQTIVEPPKPSQVGNVVPDASQKVAMIVDGETILKVSDLQKTVDMIAPAIFLLSLVTYWLMRRVVDLEERVAKLELPE
jgi:hypothetical protein